MWRNGEPPWRTMAGRGPWRPPPGQQELPATLTPSTAAQEGAGDQASPCQLATLTQPRDQPSISGSPLLSPKECFLKAMRENLQIRGGRGSFSGLAWKEMGVNRYSTERWGHESGRREQVMEVGIFHTLHTVREDAPGTPLLCVIIIC